jgi:GNAT superfamily N-acetyltransferase
MSGDLEFHAVTAERWPDLQALFSAAADTEAGNPAGCWCMEWRMDRATWRAGSGEPNRAAMERFIQEGNAPGILAYRGGETVGWCSIAPRRTLFGLKEVAAYRNFENPAVWTVSCFYVPPSARGQGMTSALLRAAVEHAAAGGAKIVEGYAAADADSYMGRLSTFQKAGFEVVGEPGELKGEYAEYTGRQRTVRFYVGGKRA